MTLKLRKPKNKLGGSLPPNSYRKKRAAQTLKTCKYFCFLCNRMTVHFDDSKRTVCNDCGHIKGVYYGLPEPLR